MQSILAYSPSYFTIVFLHQTHIIIATIRCNVKEMRFRVILSTQLNKMHLMVVLLLDFSDWIILCRNSWNNKFFQWKLLKISLQYWHQLYKILRCFYLGMHIFYQSLYIYKQYFQKWLFNIKIMCDGYEYEVIWLMMKCDTSFSCMIGTESWETWRNDKPAELIDDSNIQYFVWWLVPSV